MTTTITTAEPELRQQVWEIVTRKGGLDEQSVAILLHGIQHGLTSLDAIESAADLWVLTWSPSWRQPGYTDGPLVAAWEADQRSRSVPLVCPSWCKVEHTKIDADGDVIQPFYESAGHECSLGGKGEVIEAHLVQIQHWASDKGPRNLRGVLRRRQAGQGRRRGVRRVLRAGDRGNPDCQKRLAELI